MSIHIVLKMTENGWKDVYDTMKVKTELVARKMAQNVIANTGSIGRLREQNHPGLALGQWQHTVRKGVVMEGFFTQRSKAGWVSTRYNTSTGPFRMASFAWELARRPKSARAGYTSQLANLWAYPTKPYTTNSPFVGRVGRRRTFWQAGMSRPAKYNWTRTEQIMSESVAPAIDRTVRKYKPIWEKV